MSHKTAYELKDGEIIYTPTGEKVATWDSEKHRMARGFADEHSESVAAWVASNLPGGGGPPTTEEIAAADEVVKSAKISGDIAPAVEQPATRHQTKGAVPPKPVGKPEMGDKDPVVVAWIDAHGGPEDKTKLERWRSKGLPL